MNRKQIKRILDRIASMNATQSYVILNNGDVVACATYADTMQYDAVLARGEMAKLYSDHYYYGLNVEPIGFREYLDIWFEGLL